MPAPGTTISISDSPTARTAPTDTAVLFAVGIAEQGPLVPTEVRSITAFERVFGRRLTYSALYDYLDVAFREGLERAVVQRVTGAAPIAAAVDLQNSTPAPTLRVTANSVGEGGNRLSVKVNTPTQDAAIPSGSFVIIVLRDGVEVERSPVLADEAAAVAWVSTFVTVSDLSATGDPVAVTTAAPLTLGADDHASITTADWDEALHAIPRSLGPGQVIMAGATTSALHILALNHARDNNRVALLDAPALQSVANLASLAGLDRAFSLGAGRYGALHADYAIVPGVASGTTRAVPFNAVRAGQIARMDALGNPNEPAAGGNGQSKYAVSVAREWTDAEREELNDLGVNAAKVIYGGVRDYGWRTLADPATDGNWVMLSNVRTIMAVAAQADAIAETYVLRQIDGRGHTISAFRADLTGMLKGFYELGALFGDTIDEAFAVDVGPSVNPVDQLAQGILAAALALRVSPFAEQVVIDIVKVPVDQEL